MMSPELELFIQEEVSSGRFPDREAYIAHLVRLAQIESEETMAGIQAGFDDLDAGRVDSLDAAFDRIRKAVELPSGR